MLCFQGHAQVSASCRRPCEFSHRELWLFVVFPLKHGMLRCHPGFELLVLLSMNLQPAAFSLCFIPLLSVYLSSFSSKKFNTGYHCTRLDSLHLKVHQQSLLDGHAHKCHLKIPLKHHLYNRHLFCILSLWVFS